MEHHRAQAAVDHSRRRFIGAAALLAATSVIGRTGPAVASDGTSKVRPMPEAVDLSRGLKQIDAGDLSVGYVDAGPQDGPAVLLLHGWP